MHNRLTVTTGGSGHGHGEVSGFHWAVFYASAENESRGRCWWSKSEGVYNGEVDSRMRAGV